VESGRELSFHDRPEESRQDEEAGEGPEHENPGRDREDFPSARSFKRLPERHIWASAADVGERPGITRLSNTSTRLEWRRRLQKRVQQRD
jgi:hypothetical protein